jgi:hypothetical protein
MQQKIISECNNCNEETNHIVLFKKEIRHNKENTGSSDEKEWWCITKCAGCNNLKFVLRTFFYEPEENKLIFFDMSYPDEPEVYNFISYEELGELPAMISKLYQEVKDAFDSESAVLAGIGLRTLVEAICKQQNITGDNLKEKIVSLHSKGQISTTELPILDKLRDIGNISAHEIKAFPIDKLSYALEIVNHVIRSIYILPKINKKLKL